MHPKSLIFLSFLLILNSYFAETQTKRRKLPAVEIADHQRLLDMMKKDSANLTMVNIWATWSDVSMKEIPMLLKLQKKYKPLGFNLILLSFDDTSLIRTKIRFILGRLGVDFRTYVKKERNTEAFIMGMSPDWNGILPTSFFYNKELHLTDMMIGEKTLKDLEDAIVEKIGYKQGN